MDDYLVSRVWIEGAQQIVFKQLCKIVTSISNIWPHSWSSIKMIKNVLIYSKLCANSFWLGLYFFLILFFNLNCDTSKWINKYIQSELINIYEGNIYGCELFSVNKIYTISGPANLQCVTLLKHALGFQSQDIQNDSVCGLGEKT